MALNQLERLTASLDFHDVPVHVDFNAAAILSELPWHALSNVIQALRDWAATAPVTGIDITVNRDPEAPNWKQAVFTLHLDSVDEEALRLWDVLAAVVDSAKDSAPPDERRVLDRQLGIHLDWR